MEERNTKRVIFFIIGFLIFGGIIFYIINKTNPELFNFKNQSDTASPADTINFYDEQIDSVQDINAKSKARNIQAGLEQYYAQIGAYPLSLSDLVSDGILLESDLVGINANYVRESEYNYTLTITLSNGDKFNLSPEF